MTIHRILLVLAASLAVLVSGCGGGGGEATPEVSVDDFESAAQEARDEAQAAIQELRDVRDPSELAGALAAAADRVTNATEQLERAEAPEELEPAKEDFIQALEDLANELEQTARNVEEGDIDQALQDVRALDSLEHLEQAIADLRDAGVELEQITP